MTKKEAAKLTEEMVKLQGTLGGMRKMKRLPGAIFVVDPHRERIAVTEANKLEIPVIGTGDTNVDPDELDFIIPANDDAIRSIRLLCTLVADAAIEGARERAARAAAEPEVVEIVAMPETEDEEPGASDELVAALAGGAALTFEPDIDEEDDLLPGDRAARAEAAVADVPAEAEATPEDIAAELAREAAEKAEDDGAAPPRADPAVSDRGRAGTTGASRSTIARQRRHRADASQHRSDEHPWRTSRRSWSRNCVSGPAPGSWTARRRWPRRTATSRRRPRCCASAAWPRPPRRPVAMPARA